MNVRGLNAVRGLGCLKFVFCVIFSWPRFVFYAGVFSGGASVSMKECWGRADEWENTQL